MSTKLQFDQESSNISNYGDTPLKKLPLGATHKETLNFIRKINIEFLNSEVQFIEETINGILNYPFHSLKEYSEFNLVEKIENLKNDFPKLINKMKLYSFINEMANYDELFLLITSNVINTFYSAATQCEINFLRSQKVNKRNKTTNKTEKKVTNKHILDQQILNYQSIPLILLQLPNKYRLLTTTTAIYLENKFFDELTIEDLYSICSDQEINNAREKNIIHDLLINDLKNDLPLIIGKNKASIEVYTNVQKELFNSGHIESVKQSQYFLKIMTTLSNNCSKKKPEQEVNIDPDELKSLEPYHINYLKLTESMITQLRDLGISYNDNIGIILLRLNTIGKKLDSANQLKDFLLESVCGFLQSKAKDARILISKEQIYTYSQIDKLVIHQIDSYLMGLEEEARNIAMAMWGYNKNKLSQTVVAEKYNLTKSSIFNLWRKFRKDVRTKIGPLILEHLKDEIDKDYILVEGGMPLLLRCFENSKNFFDFLQSVCNSNKEITLSKNTKKLKLKRNILGAFFSTAPSPIDENSLIDELQSSYGFDSRTAQIFIEEYIKKQYLEKDKNGYRPRNLSSKEAVAHVLTFFPDGLPWKDVVSIVNHRKYAANVIDIKKQRENHFSNSDLVHLCSHGTYRNNIFFNLSDDQINLVMKSVSSFIKQQNTDTIHLHHYYTQAKEEDRVFGYFNIRHAIKTQGFEHNLYFNGASGVDRVSLKQGLTKMSQRDVIVKTLEQSKTALTRNEIAKVIRSKNVNQTAAYLNELMEQGFVVRVDRMAYSTPNKTFSTIDANQMLEIIREIIETTDLIVEADIFRVEVNRRMELSYSKFFYASLINCNIKHLGWYKSYNLYSKNKFEYKSLREIFAKHYNQKISKKDNIEHLRKIVMLTDTAMKTVLTNNIYNN